MDGTPFGRYRLIEMLGRGGMGEVWRAHDTATNRTVAIKLLPPHLAQDNMFVRRFRREAEAAAQLTSPHIIPIHDYGEVDGRLFVNMRLIEGRDLQQVLADGPMEPGRAVRIIEQVAKALRAAHRVGLVHRDVKPSNILLDEDDFACLIDFGIARAADQTHMTGTGSIIGSWPYMSPERLRAGQVDARSDIYALACVLYECLTGSTPYPGDNFEQQITAHLTEQPPRPSSTNPKLPVALDPVIAKGMAKDPDQRYATTIELADAARDAITVPIVRPTPGPTQPRTQPARSRVAAPTPPRDRPATPRKAGARQPSGQQRPLQVAARSTPSTSRRARRWRRKVNRRQAIALGVPALLCVAAVVFAAITGRLYLADQAVADAKRAIVRTATEAIKAMWTYSPEDMDGLPDRAAKYLYGDLRNQFSQFVKEITPANKQAKITNTTDVLASGIESFTGSDATAIVYTNMTSTSPKNQPEVKYTSYRLIMQMHDSAWPIIRMTTITSSDSEPKLPAYA
jgi:serine/threonine protein kinase